MKPKQELARITQSELAVIEALRREKANLTSTLKEVEAQLAQAEYSVLWRLTDGARVQDGELRPYIGEKIQCNPSYKDELLAHFAQAHGIDGKLVEQQVRARWTTVKEVLNIAHQPSIKSVH